MIAPMINTMEDARTFAAYSKYPPMGERSWGSYGGLGASGLDQNSYLKAANGFSMTFAMIETREAMAIVDDILALEGIDALFVGPSDLSIALSGGAKVDATAREVDEALKHVVARASAVNKPVAFYCATAERETGPRHGRAHGHGDERQRHAARRGADGAQGRAQLNSFPH